MLRALAYWSRKFLVASDPAENCRSPGHAGIGADGAEALAVGKSLADRVYDFGGVIGWSATFRLVFGLHRNRYLAWSRNLGPAYPVYWSRNSAVHQHCDDSAV